MNSEASGTRRRVTIVIIGGGFAGAYSAQQLERLKKECSVTLIDSKDHFEFTPSVLRVLVEPEHVTKIRAPHRTYLKLASVITDAVVAVDAKNVRCRNHLVPYDILIICAGSSYETPIKGKDILITARERELQQHAERIRTAQRILIIGGGIVGVELAAELVEKYPQKKIIFVHSKKTVIQRSNARAQEAAASFLRERGVELILNERVIDAQGNQYRTNKKRTIAADIALLCTGIVPNTQFLNSHFKDDLDSHKHIRVNQYLQMRKNIFVAGDCSNIHEEKTAQNAEEQAKVVVKNVRHLIQGDHGEAFESYHPRPRAMVISLGKSHGILTYKNWTLTGRIPALLKSLIAWKTMRRYS